MSFRLESIDIRERFYIINISRTVIWIKVLNSKSTTVGGWRGEYSCSIFGGNGGTSNYNSGL